MFKRSARPPHAEELGAVPGGLEGGVLRAGRGRRRGRLGSRATTGSRGGLLRLRVHPQTAARVRRWPTEDGCGAPAMTAGGQCGASWTGVLQRHAIFFRARQ